jgi:hypothetical protein
MRLATLRGSGLLKPGTFDVSELVGKYISQVRSVRRIAHYVLEAAQMRSDAPQNAWRSRNIHGWLVPVSHEARSVGKEVTDALNHGVAVDECGSVQVSLTLMSFIASA